MGPVTWCYYYLYLILDIFSRYVVGWMVARRELAVLAKELIAETCKKQRIVPDQLVLHADRGSSMKSKTLAQLLVGLGVDKSHSRPHTSNDNPFSEAQFKTAKYHSSYPERFGCIEDARAHFGVFFPWYNWQHHHGELGLFVPGDVHYGNVEQRLMQRNETLEAAYMAHPERFVSGQPVAAKPPSEVWINKPIRDEHAQPEPEAPAGGAVCPSPTRFHHPAAQAGSRPLSGACLDATEQQGISSMAMGHEEGVP